MAEKSASAGRTDWFDAETQIPLIDQHARKLESFLSAMADGVIDQQEVQTQESRVFNLLKELDPLLDDALHARVTDLLCELTAYDLMRVLHEFQQARPKSTFRG